MSGTTGTTSVIVAGARTPMGRLLGSLKSFSGADLGAFAIRAALERAGVEPGQVEYVIMGQVLQAGAGQIPARQAAVRAGIPMSVPALTVNKVCLSGLDAVALADQLIRAGEFDIVVAGGQESMTNAPHLLPKSREGFKYGAVEMLDSMAYDGLTDAFDNIAMGESTEHHNTRLGIGRAEQDEIAALSHQRAAAAQKNGIFEAEITPVEIPQRKGEPVVCDRDEGIRPETTVESLARLRPAFSADGTITAGSSSQISDGAAAVVVMSRAKAEELGLEWIAEIGAHGNVAGPDNSLQSQPSNAILHALRKEGIDIADLDLIEINEAFAAVAVQSVKDLGVSLERVNVNGGAIALGHPIGMSGARLVLHLALELKPRTDLFGERGAAFMVDVPELVAQAREGRPRAVARLISLVEGASPQLREVMAALSPLTGGAFVIGLTGSPGVGKSTTTSALVTAYRKAGKRVGVLAVDPSSPFSGGALLGDRVRMSEHASDPGVYIRSMATRGHLGGLAWAAPQAIRVLDAAGCEVILVETVGVGQSEVEIAAQADTCAVLLAPGMGDGIQAAKAGILEIGDIYAVNKADREGADATARELNHMLGLGEARGPGDWRPPIVRTVAARGEGIDQLVEAVEKHRAWMEEHGALTARRVRRAAAEIETIAVTALRTRLADVHGDRRLAALASRVVAGDIDPYRASDAFLADLTGVGG